MADLTASSEGRINVPTVEPSAKEEVGPPPATSHARTSLHYNIQVHLPATKDIEVYNAIFKSIKARREAALKDTWLEGEKSDLLGFVDFGHLAQLIIAKWNHFKDIIPTQHWLKQRTEELEKARNFIAHNRMLLPSEFQRLYMYVNDWNYVIGL